MDESTLDALAQARGETRAAYENRARIYRHIYEELAAELGAERAAAVMSRAIRRRGEEVAEAYRAAAAAADLDEVARVFVDSSACGGELFEPGVESREEGAVVLRMTACPLVDAWRADGLAPGEVDRMCEIASAFDYGTFEGAGLTLEFLDRQACPGSTRCLLKVSLPR
ncbi:MAG: hypothetical protein FDZ70_02545 [Actinobacteria bacterium]|nr:MAG: hypothetical protein FDZ70_02545 [Actinomycetota bacterium]